MSQESEVNNLLELLEEDLLCTCGDIGELRSLLRERKDHFGRISHLKAENERMYELSGRVWDFLTGIKNITGV